eukprot:GHVO01044560.1.p1 GENE.GHVO01044560.1~~GHVO01044560.1.p1  ORF type:complete len:198 (+),score=21.47 GHVO01044560.1:237-830(+)
MRDVDDFGSDVERAATEAHSLLSRAIETIKVSYPNITCYEPNSPSPSATPMMLAHPDEFKNPSSFLKIYGDPLCCAGTGNLRRGKNGNWECSRCLNVNYPRRFRCNKCNTLRDVESDKIVAEYTRLVYTEYLPSFRSGGGLLGATRDMEDEVSATSYGHAMRNGNRRFNQYGSSNDHHVPSNGKFVQYGGSTTEQVF